jgi:hypothetical protein
LNDSDLGSGLSEVEFVSIEEVAEIESLTKVTRKEGNSESSGDTGLQPPEESSLEEDDVE